MTDNIANMKLAGSGLARAARNSGLTDDGSKLGKIKRKVVDLSYQAYYFLDDHAVEIQTVAVVLAGIVLTNEVVKSQKQIVRELESIQAELVFHGDTMAFEGEEARRFRWIAQREIDEATSSGRPFTFYPGLGVRFDDKD